MTRPFLLAALAFSLFLSLPALAAPTAVSPAADADGEERQGTFRVLTYNVYYGFSRENEKHHAQWLQWMADLTPDVVALQELNGYTEERLAEEAASWGHPHAALLKEDGFPVGLTSRWPIEDVARLQEGFHHGAIRGRIRGITFYALHFSPRSWEHRIREAELILADIAELPRDQPRVVLLGDFNGLSPQDREHHEADEQLLPYFVQRDESSRRQRNLNQGRLEYGGIQTILDGGFVDLQARFRGPNAPVSGTLPTALIRDKGPDRRIDYLFASANLASTLLSARVIRDEDTDRFSDHYPVLADFELELED